MRQRKHDFSIFSRQELANFLQKYENSFLYTGMPFDIIIGDKMNEISQQIAANIEDGEKLTVGSGTTKESFAYLKKINENYVRWERLNKEYDRLSKLRFGD